MELSWVAISQALHEGVYFVVYQLGLAVAAPLVYNSELYWVFLCSGFAIAWLSWKLYLIQTHAPASDSQFIASYFSKAIWWHPSARVDYLFYIVNGLLMAGLMGQFWITDRSVLAWLSPTSPPDVVVGDAISFATRLLFTVLFFIVYDLGRFVAHSLLHDVTWLWEFHKVHHSAQVLTPITASRVHPVDLAVMAWVPALFTGVLTWSFNQWVASEVTVITFMGFHVLVWFFNLVDHLRHWHVWVSYGAQLNQWFISPAHHQLHHSASPEHWGVNRGYELAIWDRLYGTFLPPQAQHHTAQGKVFEFGLGDGTDAQWQSVRALFLKPLEGVMLKIKQRVWKTKSANDGVQRY